MSFVLLTEFQKSARTNERSQRDQERVRFRQRSPLTAKSRRSASPRRDVYWGRGIWPGSSGRGRSGYQQSGRSRSQSSTRYSKLASPPPRDRIRSEFEPASETSARVKKVNKMLFTQFRNLILRRNETRTVHCQPDLSIMGDQDALQLKDQSLLPHLQETMLLCLELALPSLWGWRTSVSSSLVYFLKLTSPGTQGVFFHLRRRRTSRTSKGRRSARFASLKAKDRRDISTGQSVRHWKCAAAWELISMLNMGLHIDICLERVEHLLR